MDDTDFKKQRTSLFAISVFIIIYYFGEGSVTDQGGMLGGSVEFKKPALLEIAGSFIFAWFLWRYIITGKKLIFGYLAHYRLHLYLDHMYGKILKESFQKIPKDFPEYEKVNNLINSFNNVWSAEKFTQRNIGSLPPTIKCNLFPNRFILNESIGIQTSRLDEIDDAQHWQAFRPSKTSQVTYEFKAPFWKLLALESRIFITTAVRNKPFSDIVAPLLFAITAGILLILKALT